MSEPPRGVGQRDWVVTIIGTLGAGVVLLSLVGAFGPSLWQKWNMSRCPSLVQSDLDEVISERDPKVDRCIGQATNAMCFVESLEGGVRKTAPLTWDCTGRRVPDGLRDAALRLGAEHPEEAAHGPPDLERLARLAVSYPEFRRRFQAGLDYAVPRLAARQALLGQK
jgi:hypothetical protein